MTAPGKLLVLGAHGRLGAALVRTWSPVREVHGWGRREADLAAPAAAAEAVRASRPAVVVNCAALSDVDSCEQRRRLARVVNADAPAALAAACTQSGSRLIHISTDYVFSGKTGRPYAEDDSPDPLSWYGQTKLQGERAVLAAGGRHAVVRVSWLFGPDRESFLDQALHKARRGEVVEAVADKWSSPTYTVDVAGALPALFDPATPGGVYHVCNRGVCTWSEWAGEGIKAAAELGIRFGLSRPVQPVDLAELETLVARRPVYSPMTCGRIEALSGRPMRTWQEAVADYVRFLVAEGRLG